MRFHTITSPPTRGENIKYFKTGLGSGEKSLKSLVELIQQNNHQDQVIEYLKVIAETLVTSRVGTAVLYSRNDIPMSVRSSLGLVYHHPDVRFLVANSNSSNSCSLSVS